jgi:hypothetical protein
VSILCVMGQSVRVHLAHCRVDLHALLLVTCTATLCEHSTPFALMAVQLFATTPRLPVLPRHPLLPPPPTHTHTAQAQQQAVGQGCTPQRRVWRL